MYVTQLTKCVEPSLVYKTEYTHRFLCVIFFFTRKELKQRSKWWNLRIWIQRHRNELLRGSKDQHLPPDCLTFFREVFCGCRSIFSHPFPPPPPLLCPAVLPSPRLWNTASEPHLQADETSPAHARRPSNHHLPPRLSGEDSCGKRRHNTNLSTPHLFTNGPLSQLLF